MASCPARMARHVALLVAYVRRACLLGSATLCCLPCAWNGLCFGALLGNGRSIHVRHNRSLLRFLVRLTLVLDQYGGQATDDGGQLLHGCQ